MAGMLQILTYLLAVYLIVKGIEVLQIGLASNRESRRSLIVVGAITLALCVISAGFFVNMQDEQAKSLRSSMPSMPNFGNP